MENNIKLVILDRDGVVNDNSQHYYVYTSDDFKFNPGVLESIAYFTRKGCKIAIVSNQSGIAKGIYTMQDIDKLHKWMIDEIAKFGGKIDKIYICPHHPSVSECRCRKPKPLLLQKAMEDLGAQQSETIFIGDNATDVQAGNAAGISTFKVEPNGNLFQQLRKLKLITKSELRITNG